MPNPLKRDPTKTTMIRKRFMADMKRRFRKISIAIQKLVVTDDVFGLVESELLTFQEKQAFRFLSNPNKVKAYRKWLQQQIDANVLVVDAVNGKPWTSTYVESTYRKAMMKSYTDVHKEALSEDVSFYQGGKAQFLRDAFNAPEVLSKVELLYTRAFDELKGVTDVMSQQMSRILADGLVQGIGPVAIARELRKNVVDITKRRALTIARTEVIRAHAEGQLDAYERLGVEEVNLLAEWLTAGDERVCTECDSLASSGPYKIDEARGMMPAHPNCRCAWAPYTKDFRSKQEEERKAPEFSNTYSNFNYADLSTIDKNAMLEYQSGIYNSKVGGFGTIQTYLRETRIAKWLTKEGITSQKVKAVVSKIDDTISKAITSSNITLYRGVRNSSQVFKIKNISDLKVGLQFTDEGYFSTSTSKTIAKKFTNKLNSWEDPKLFYINVPSGSNAFPMDIVSKIGEKEIVLPRNSKFIITKMQGNNIYLDIVK